MENLYDKASEILNQVKQAVVGKDDAIDNIFAAILAGGHILIEDMPGVGKTTMALSFAKAMGISKKRIQFTTDIMPSDLVGFSIYDNETKLFKYQSGALMCNLFLADEINRTSPKTQAALLEVMEEKQITVDGVTRSPGKPFVVIATENPEGSAGTQPLPDSQLDRFMICIHMGYPSVDEEVEILKRRQKGNPIENVRQVCTVEDIIAMQNEINDIYIHDLVFDYAEPYGGNPKCVVERTIQKSIGKENKVSVFDYDGKKDKYEEAIDLAIENKIELGYTNYCFDLWLILHKEDYFDIVQNQDAYADKLRQVFGLAADANIKKEKRVTEIVNQIGLSDIKNAIQRGKKISEDNQGKEANKTPKENRYYDNPDTQMHVLLQFLFAKVGINIDALG